MELISTGGAAINATMKQIDAASKQGTIRVPNQPTYNRLSVEVTHEQKRSHKVSWGRCKTDVVMKKELSK